MKRWLSAGLALLVLAAIGGFFWWQWVISPSGIEADQVFVVTKGESLEPIASRLKEAGFIRSAFAFKLFVLAQGQATQIQAGDFRLNGQMNLRQVVEQLSRGTLDIWVTLLEGWRSEQMAQKLIDEGFPIDLEAWQQVVDESNLEGFLFPDTYLVPKGASSETIIDLLKKNFDKKVDAQLKKKISVKGLTLNQAITLASMVEREVRADRDRPIVAGILIKRWQNEWPLQTDAAVQYAIGSVVCQGQPKCEWWPKSLTRKDLEIDSPYNTYKYKGLPSRPICSPGLAAIEAVANYQESPYWFYLSDLQGITHYGRTIEEHNANVAKYLGK